VASHEGGAFLGLMFRRFGLEHGVEDLPLIERVGCTEVGGLGALEAFLRGVRELTRDGGATLRGAFEEARIAGGEQGSPITQRRVVALGAVRLRVEPAHV
jgi:hypothetical protein